jgi:uncharacterized protein YjiK
MNRSDVFLSYRRADVEFVKQLHAALEATGRDVWIDWDDIPPGVAGFTGEIEAGIEGADVFVAVLSPTYLDSEYCLMELSKALELNKRLVPIVYQKFEGNPPSGIGHINWVYFCPHAGQTNTFEEAFPKVIQAIEADFDHMRAHTRLLLRAREWDIKQRQASFLLKGQEVTEAERWLGASTGKKPEPLKLHTEYIITSRAAETQRQRRILTGVSVALVVSIVLTIAAVLLGIEADNQRGRAETNRQIAVTNEAQAVAAKATAVRNADISRSVALASGAREANTHDQIEAVALGLESVNITDAPALAQRVLAEVAYQPGVVRVFTGHTDVVTSVAYSPDGQMAVSGSEDETLILWDVKTGNALRPLIGHGDRVTSVAFSPDGKTVVSGSADKTVILWDVETGDLLKTLPGHSDRVLDVAFSPNGKTVASASRDATVIIWDVETGDLSKTLTGHTNRVFTVAYSADGKMLVSGSEDKTLMLWDVETGALLRQFSGHGDVVNSAVFSPDGKSIFSGSSDTRTIRWDTAKGEPATINHDHSRPVTAVAYDPNGRYSLSGGNDSKLVLRDLLTGSTHVYTGLTFINDITFSPERI